MKVRISAVIEVTDPEKLLAFVKDRYAKAWSDNSYQPDSIAEAVREAVINSNDNPDNDRIGIEILDYEHQALDDAAQNFEVPDMAMIPVFPEIE